MNKMIENFLKDYRETLTYDINKIYYHYTRVDAFLSILENQKIFFSDYRYLKGDYTEYKYSHDRIVGFIRDRKSFENGIISKFEKLFTDFSRSEYHRCVFSLTTLYNDSDKWKNYGDAGKGICFGIKPSEYYRRNLGKVFCDKKDQEKHIEDWLEKYLKVLDETDATDDEIAQGLYRLCCYIQPYLKNPKYREKEEYRYANAPFSNDVTSESDREFMQVKLADNDGNIPIVEVIIGPKHPDKQKLVIKVQSLLRNKGYSDVKIIQ
jgi:hypothetical protein